MGRNGANGESQMKFSIDRESLLKPLNLVAGVVERRNTLPVLSNALVALEGDHLVLTGTDLEVELAGHITLSQAGDNGEVTVPARKLADICKSLPEGSRIDVSLDDQRLLVRCGRSRFTLSTLPASEFPNIDQAPAALEFTLQQGQLRRLIDGTAFAMAQQDVRYYLNGMLFEVTAKHIRTVATDGHRLALSTLGIELPMVRNDLQVILPRKGVLELQRLLQSPEADVRIVVGSTLFQAITPEFSFTSKLVDGKFPDYERVLPRAAGRTMIVGRSEVKDALVRTAILSNEKFRGVRAIIEPGNLQIMASNPEQEEAEENVAVEYTGERVEIGFNVSYLIDVFSVLAGETVRIRFADGSSSVLIEDPGNEAALYVVMPMRL
jgi:DNA polymerase III subunit beta